jgi:hypothetical protein
MIQASLRCRRFCRGSLWNDNGWIFARPARFELHLTTSSPKPIAGDLKGGKANTPQLSIKKMATGSTPAKICVGDLVPELKKLPLTSAEASFDKRPRIAKRWRVGRIDRIRAHRGYGKGSILPTPHGPEGHHVLLADRFPDHRKCSLTLLADFDLSLHARFLASSGPQGLRLDPRKSSCGGRDLSQRFLPD